MSNINKSYDDVSGIYTDLIEKMLSTDENKMYEYFINKDI